MQIEKERERRKRGGLVNWLVSKPEAVVEARKKTPEEETSTQKGTVIWVTPDSVIINHVSSITIL